MKQRPPTLCVAATSPNVMRSRKRLNVQTRSVFARIAIRNHGFKGIEVAKALSLSPPTVSRIVENGEKILENNRGIAVKVATMEI